jgi:hypothetical protein
MKMKIKKENPSNVAAPIAAYHHVLADRRYESCCLCYSMERVSSRESSGNNQSVRKRAGKTGN